MPTPTPEAPKHRRTPHTPMKPRRPKPEPLFAPGDMQKLRTSVRLTQAVVAERMGYPDPWQYRRWERGISVIGMTRAEQFLSIIEAERESLAQRELSFAERRTAQLAATKLPKAS